MKKISLLFTLIASIALFSSCGNKKNQGIPLWVVENGDTVAVYHQFPEEEYDLMPNYTLDSSFDVLSLKVSNEEQVTDFDLLCFGTSYDFPGLIDYKSEIVRVKYPFPGKALIQFHRDSKSYFVYFKPDDFTTQTAYGMNIDQDTLNQYVEVNKENAQFADYTEFEVALTLSFKFLGDKKYKNYCHFCSFVSDSGITTRVSAVAKQK